MIKKFSRKKNHRQMMLRNLVTSLVLYEKIKTTITKGKETRKIIDKIINIGKKNNLYARRRLISYLLDKNAIKKIFEVLISRYKDKTSGYTQIFKLEERLGDGSQMVLIKLIPDKVESIVEKEDKKINTKKKKDNSKIKAKK